MRKKIIAANWKMNKNPNEAVEFVNNLKEKINNNTHEVVLCVPYIDLLVVRDSLKNYNISVGAQNVFYEDAGAYTGEISAKILKESGINYVIIGHSERREIFHESDQDINKKILKSLEHDLKIILCVGESLEQRENKITIEFIKTQIKNALENIREEKLINIAIAYEPIWAIGTGKTATSEQAQEICLEIRKYINKIYSENAGENIRILYGGSVNANNAHELFNMPDIDGGLIGGASLKQDFIRIVNY